MGFGSRAFLAGGLGFAAAFAVACGGSNGLLSSDQNASFSGQLNSISSALDSHDCGAAASAATSLNNAVANLPPTVNTTLRQNLGQGAATVSQLATQNCHGSTTATTSSSSTTTTTTTTTTTSNPTSSTSATSQTNTNSNTGTATNPPGPGTSSTSNGGAGLGGKGTGTSGNGGNGK